MLGLYILVRHIVPICYMLAYLSQSACVNTTYFGTVPLPPDADVVVAALVVVVVLIGGGAEVVAAREVVVETRAVVVATADLVVVGLLPPALALLA